MSVDNPTKQSLRIAAIYVFFAVVWILFSDRAIGWCFSDPRALTIASSVKGCLFVLVTGTVLFVLTRRQLRVAGETVAKQCQAEQAGRESEERFQALAALSPDIISIFDREGRIRFNSAAALRVHGYREADLLGKSTFELIHPDDRAAVRATFTDTLREPGAAKVVRYRYRNADGSYVWMEAAGRNEIGNPHIQGVIAISRDISERIRAEQILRESELHLNRAEEIAGLGHWTLHLERGEAFGSEGAQRIFGVKGARMTVDQLQDLTVPEQRARLEAGLQGLVEKGTVFDGEYRVRRASDGKLIDIHALAEFDPANRTVFGTIQDITARKQAEAEMRLESAALAAAANAIAIMDRTGRVVWVNPAFTTLTGYEPAEACGRGIGELLGSGRHERGFFAQMWDTILADKPWHGEVTNRRKDGSLYQEEQTITPVHDEQNIITHFIAIKQDVSARRALEAQVYRSQRLDSIGCLAGGIAHDLNNILLPILLSPAVLRETVTDPKSLATLDAVETSAKRGASVIRQLLTFSRGSQAGGERVLVQWRHIVREMLIIMRETFPKNIAVVPRFVGDIWLIPADPTQLHQVLMNLCVNARDAMPDGGTLTLGLENVELSEAEVQGIPQAAPGPHVLLTVTDTGIGIAPEHLDKIFDPFFTTKEVGRGTGLGLSSALGIVRAHRGIIHVSSKVGEGTQFKVYLPASRTEVEPAGNAAAAAAPSGSGECLLLVDDEDSVRTVTGRILESHGYRVIMSRNGAEGLAAYKEFRTQIAAVVTDIMMPVMDGQTLIRHLREIDPAVRVIAISGYLGQANVSSDWMQTSAAVLLKPFEAGELLVTVRDVLHASGEVPEARRKR